MGNSNNNFAVIGIIAFIVLFAIAIFSFIMNSSSSNSTTSNESVKEVTKSVISQPSEPKEKPAEKSYTGYCQIVGTYRNRYVTCTDDYNPEAKARAEAKATECNASTTAVHGCKDIYR